MLVSNKDIIVIIALRINVDTDILHFTKDHWQRTKDTPQLPLVDLLSSQSQPHSSS